MTKHSTEATRRTHIMLVLFLFTFQYGIFSKVIIRGTVDVGGGGNRENAGIIAFKNGQDDIFPHL